MTQSLPMAGGNATGHCVSPLSCPQGDWFFLAWAGVVAMLLYGCTSSPADRGARHPNPSEPEPAISAAPAVQLRTALARFTFTSPHMGTLFSLTLYADSPATAASAAEAAFQRIAQIEHATSDYLAESEVMRLCAANYGEAVPVSEDLFRVLERAQHISRTTEGAFDITVGHFTRLWRFTRKRLELPSDTALAAAADTLGWKHVQLDAATRTATLQRPRMRLDLGGIAKGFAADEALAVLQERGLPRALIAASGDVRVGESPPGKAGWVVDVAGTDAVRLVLTNAAVSTSGDTEQLVEMDGVRYSHIVSPFTGLGLTNRIQATVIAPEAATADALATACCVLGPDKALALVNNHPDVAALILSTSSGQRIEHRSTRFPPSPL